ncbi:MAG: ABC transporter substrate-binding protein [Gemmatimonadetes bacterium]|nr:ABC transporter substrate-binding protein [Gemmatimonadota bacterium]
MRRFYSEHAPVPAARSDAIRAWLEYTALFVVALVLFWFAFACDSASRRDPSRAATGGTLVIAGPTDLDHANPLVSADGWAQEINRFLLFLPLVRFGPDLDIQPWLARSWTLHGDTAVTFVLRRDVLWHDGRRTSARDVEFTFAAATDTAIAHPSAGYFTDWISVEAVDSFTVHARFRPHADPLAGVALLPIAPAHLLDTIPPAQLRAAAFNRAPIGNGPFRFASQLPGDRWVFEANADFPPGLGGRPHLDRIVWRVIPDRQAQLTELLTDNAHVVLIPPAERFVELASRDGLHGYVRPTFKYAFIGWNGLRAPFSDARVRRGLTMAIDRAEILGALRSGHGTLAAAPVHPNHWAYDPALEAIPFDSGAARALLARAGLTDRDGDGTLEHADGSPFRFELEFQASNDFNRNMAEMIAADLSAIGVHAVPRPLDWNTLVSHVSSPDRTFDAVLMGWEADFRIDLRDLFHSASLGGPFQLASYRDAGVDSLLDAVTGLADRKAALPLWHDVQQRLRDDQPWTFLYFFPDLILTSSRLQGVDMDLRGAFATLAMWWLEEPVPDQAALTGG